MDTIDKILFQNSITKLQKSSLHENNKRKEVLRDFYIYLNQVITSLSQSEKECIDLLGGWQQILPIVLNSVSSASALSGYSYSTFIGSGIKLISNLTILLQDYSAKKALKELIEHRNNKILACTYFTIQHASCEFKRAYNYSQQHKKLKISSKKIPRT